MAFVKRKKAKDPPTQGNPPEGKGDLIFSSAPDEIVPEENYQSGIIVGSEEPDSRMLPKPKGIVLTFDEVMEYLGSLTPEQWTHCIAYVYRLYPLIDRKLIDPTATSNIEKLSGPTTSQDFVARHGGGKYKILINDLDKERNNKSRSVCRSTFEIPWTRFLPIINYGELMVNDIANKPYLTFLTNKGILNEDYSVNDGNKNGNVGDMIGFMNRMLDRMESSNKTMIETVKASANTGNSEAINIMRLLGEERDKRESLMIQMMNNGGGMKDFEQMMAVLKEIRPAETGMNGQIALFQQMLTMQAENHKTQMDMVMALINNKKEDTEEKKEPKTLKDQILELKEMGDVLGMGNGGKKSTVEIVFDKLGDVVEKIGPSITMFLMQRYGGMPNPVPQMNPNPAPMHTQQSQETIMIDKLDYEKLAAQFIQQYGTMIIGQIESGINGGDAADALITVMGGNKEPYLQIKSIGKDNIIAAAKSHPAFWQRVCLDKGEEYVIQFITDFFDPPEIEEEEGTV